MAKYVIDSSTLEGLGDAIRSVTGTDRKYTPEEMIEEVKDILNSTTFILVDVDGNEYMAAYVDSDTVVTATANDIRKGTTAITSEGVIVGEKEIPAYRAEEGVRVIRPTGQLSIPVYSDMCEYTHLQVIVCRYNNSVDDSVSSEKVVIDSNVYDTGSTSALSGVTVDADAQTINLGLINDSNSSVVIRYVIIKEDTQHD